MKAMPHIHHLQRGLVLVSSLLLLLVVTIMALSMFRSFGVQEKIAGNVREKHRALQSAETAEGFAEIWLVNNNMIVPTATCSNQLLDANLNQVQICNLASDLPTVIGGSAATAPWKVNGNGLDVGVQYLPSTMAQSQTGGVDTYHDLPRFYITDLGTAPAGGPPGEVYKIYAAGTGGSADAVAVVQSTFLVYTSSWNPEK